MCPNSPNRVSLHDLPQCEDRDAGRKDHQMRKGWIAIAMFAGIVGCQPEPPKAKHETKITTPRGTVTIETESTNDAKPDK